MPDLQNKLENVLKEFTPGGMERYPDILYPQYQGYSLSNIPSTVCHLLNVPGMGEPALCGEYLDKFTESFDKVVLVVVDALGYDLLAEAGRKCLCTDDQYLSQHDLFSADDPVDGCQPGHPWGHRL